MTMMYHLCCILQSVFLFLHFSFMYMKLYPYTQLKTKKNVFFSLICLSTSRL